MTPSKALFYFLLSFIGGVFVSSLFNIPKPMVYEFFVLGVFYFVLAFFLRKQTEFKRALTVFAVCLVFLGFGIWRTESAKLSGDGPPEVYRGRPSGDLLLEALFGGLREKLKGVIYQNFSPPHSSILAALTLGDKKRIPDAWKQKLNLAGVRHVTAISGMHIIILAAILTWLFIALGFYRQQAFYLALFLIWFFILFVGFQPSALRAGIMGSVFLVSEALGRRKAGVRTLILAGAIMLLFNPLMLRGNIGFQLSFLATLGLIYLSSPVKRFLERAKFLKTLNVSYLLAVTLSAQIFVLPILIYNFGYFSLVSPITNILIVPILPVLMGLGLLFLTAALLFPPLGFLVSLFLWPLMSYLVLVVDFFSKLKIASVALEVSWLLIPVYYLFLFSFIYRRSELTETGPL